jgi:hypothetical protein
MEFTRRGKRGRPDESGKNGLVEGERERRRWIIINYSPAHAIDPFRVNTKPFVQGLRVESD